MKHVFSLLLFLNGTILCAQNEKKKFEELRKNENWNLVLNDDCKKDWTEQWTLDGLVATVENSRQGMHFKAGPEFNNDANHAVLWTKESFTGDVKIKYDFTRTDNQNKYVNILYIQATGDGENGYDSDISKWSAKRNMPSMRTYFNNMDLLHISYAAFGNKGDGTFYVRARRYPVKKDISFQETRIKPSYDMQGFVKSDQKYHITAIKTGKRLFFKMESKDGAELFHWDLSDVAKIKEGRIGLRHMFTRSAMYKNFKIYTR